MAIDLIQVIEQIGRKLPVLKQPRRVRTLSQWLAAHHQHLRLALAQELRKLEHAHPEQRVQQQRQHRDHEQRTPIAQLIANLAAVNQSYVAPRHGVDRKAFSRSRRDR